MDACLSQIILCQINGFYYTLRPCCAMCYDHSLLTGKIMVTITHNVPDSMPFYTNKYNLYIPVYASLVIYILTLSVEY